MCDFSSVFIVEENFKAHMHEQRNEVNRRTSPGVDSRESLPSLHVVDPDPDLTPTENLAPIELVIDMPNSHHTPRWLS